MSNPVVFFESNSGLKFLVPTQEAIATIGLASIMKKDLPEDATNVRLGTTDDLPEDRSSRSQWRLNPAPTLPIINVPGA